MKLFGRDAFHAVAYAGNQAFAVLTTILLIRYGQHSFSLPWILGALLALGWGTVGFGLLAPVAVARMWSAPSARALSDCSRALTLALVGSGVLVYWPPSGSLLAEYSGVSAHWLYAFVAIGLVRAYAQALSTLSIRRGGHGRILRFQFGGRFFEIALAIAAGQLGNGWLLVGTWLVYPVGQLAIVSTEWRSYQDEALPVTPLGSGRANVLIIAGQLLDLVMPTLWLRQAGPEVFVAYRMLSSALSNATMLPRYWFVLHPNKPRDEKVGAAAVLLVIITTLTLSGAFQFGSGAVPWDMFAWSVLPMLTNGAVMPWFSRLRQLCLNQGKMFEPALAAIVGRGAEIFLLLVLARMGVGLSVCILAYCGFALCAPALHYFYRRNARCSTA